MYHVTFVTTKLSHSPHQIVNVCPPQSRFLNILPTAEIPDQSSNLSISTLTPDLHIMAEVVRTEAQSPLSVSRDGIARSKVKLRRPTERANLARTDGSSTQERSQSERKPRKSVAFSDDTTVMDENGEISEGRRTDDDKVTAEKHSISEKFPVSATRGLGLTMMAATDTAVDEVTDMFAGLNKKKKKPSKPKAEEGADGEAAAAPAADAEFDASLLKKKKKKPSKPKTDGDDFEAKLASAGLHDTAPEANGTVAESAEQTGDMDAGTGIWSHDATAPISYDLLLKRFFKLVNEYNPDILSTGSKSYKIPPPQCLREGNKKTIFANIAEICKRMNRNDEHVTQFLFAELGTSGSVDGNKRLVIKGRFQQKQIENVLRRYIGKTWPLSIHNLKFDANTNHS